MGFADTRLQLHWAAQAAAGVGRTLLPKQPDSSHESFRWSDDLGALLQGAPAGLRIRDLTLLRLDERGAAIDELAMNGRTLAEGFAFFGIPIVDPPEGMPEHPVARGARFDVDFAELEKLASFYADAHRILQRVREREAGAGPVRCWPHHFDIATLIALGGERTIGAGMSPGDASYADPYFYVTPWPYPPAAGLTPLRIGRWHTEGWTGAVLPASERNVEAFLVEAVARCRALARPYITCRQLIDFIGDYVGGELDAAARADFERHLAVCRSCQAYLDSYRTTKELVRTLASDEPAPDVPEDLVATILARTQRDA